MKVIEKSFPRGDIYPIEKLTDGSVPILFDIETTGLNAMGCIIYMIGMMEITSDTLLFTQFFADSPADEGEVLSSFLKHLPEKPCLISFNGRGFDIPFLCKKCKAAGIPCYLPQYHDIDLYRSLAPLKEYFGMNSRRLVAYEQLIGLEREDHFNGGELIEVYKEYVGKRKFAPDEADRLEKFLLLHNEEDIVDMVPVMGLLTYIDLLNASFSSASFSFSENSAEIRIETDSDFPVSHDRTFATVPGLDPFVISCCGRSATLKIPVYSGTLRHFFADYKDYYYLPDEDCAVHKSLALNVDAGHRIKATRATAFVKANGTFIPQCGNVLTPFFKKEEADRITFIQPTVLKDEAAIRRYVKEILNS